MDNLTSNKRKDALAHCMPRIKAEIASQLRIFRTRDEGGRLAPFFVLLMLSFIAGVVVFLFKGGVQASDTAAPFSAYLLVLLSAPVYTLAYTIWTLGIIPVVCVWGYVCTYVDCCTDPDEMLMRSDRRGYYTAGMVAGVVAALFVALLLHGIASGIVHIARVIQYAY